MRRIWVLGIVLLLMVLSGCAFEFDLWLNADGSGHGTITYEGDGETFNLEETKADLTKKGLSVQEIKQVGNDLIIKADWQKENLKIFDLKQRTNHDGTITVYSEKYMLGQTYTLHLPGEIVSVGESGFIQKDKRSVYFEKGYIQVTYKPDNIIIKILFFIFVLFGITGIVIYFVHQHNKKQQLTTEEGKNGSPEKPVQEEKQDSPEKPIGEEKLDNTEKPIEEEKRDNPEKPVQEEKQEKPEEPPTGEEKQDNPEKNQRIE